MTMFTQGRLQTYERMMQDTGRNRRREAAGSAAVKPGKPERPAGKTDIKPNAKRGDRHGSVQG